MTVDTGEHLNIVSAVNFKGRYAVSGNYSIRQIDRQQAFADRDANQKRFRPKLTDKETINVIIVRKSIKVQFKRPSDRHSSSFKLVHHFEDVPQVGFLIHFLKPSGALIVNMASQVVVSSSRRT